MCSRGGLARDAKSLSELVTRRYRLAGRPLKLTGQWSILWDKRRYLWIAAEDDPDGIQIEEPDLDVLLTRAGM